MSKFRTAGSSIELDSEWIEKMARILKGQPVGLYGRISGQKSQDGSSLDSQIAVNRLPPPAARASSLKRPRSLPASLLHPAPSSMPCSKWPSGESSSSSS
jgi:hypothetical protein